MHVPMCSSLVLICLISLCIPPGRNAAGLDFSYLSPAGDCQLIPRTYYRIDDPSDGSVLASNNGDVVSTVPTGGDQEKWWVQRALQFPEAMYWVFHKDDRALTARKQVNGEIHAQLSPFNGSRDQMFKAIGNTRHCVLQLADERAYLSSGRLRNDGDLLPDPLKMKVIVSDDSARTRQFLPLPCEPHPLRRYRIIHRVSGDLLSFHPRDELATLFLAEKRPEQFYTFIRAEDDPTVLHIRHNKSGQVLSIRNHTTIEGGLLIREGLHGGHGQKFYLKPSPDGKFCSIANLGSRRYLLPKDGHLWVTANTPPVRIGQLAVMETLEGQWLLDPDEPED